MYLTDFRENTLQDVITKLEPELFKAVTGLSVADFDLLVSLGVFNSTHMNQAVFAFRRYEDASPSYTGIQSRQGLRRHGLYETWWRWRWVRTAGEINPAALFALKLRVARLGPPAMTPGTEWLVRPWVDWPIASIR